MSRMYAEARGGLIRLGLERMASNSYGRRRKNKLKEKKGRIEGLFQIPLGIQQALRVSLAHYQYFVSALTVIASPLWARYSKYFMTVIRDGPFKASATS